MWTTINARLALLELLSTGQLKRRRSQCETFDALAQLSWTWTMRRRDHIGVVDARRFELVALLDRVWPEWRVELAHLVEVGLPPTPEGWSALEDRRRAEGLPDLPALLNRRTAASLTAGRSKAGLSDTRRASLGSTEATHDGIVRLRLDAPLVARLSHGSIDLAATASLLGEAALPERALRQGLTLEGQLSATLLVENLGAWRDVVVPPGWLVVHVPGWDTATVSQLLERIARAPIVHFGDLDPNGVRIFLHLRERHPDLRWFVPEFWREQLALRAQPGGWPPDLDLTNAPDLVRELAGSGRWLEQEAIVLDPRLHLELDRIRKPTSCG